MAHFTYKRVNNARFAAYHAVYADNAGLSYDWNERLREIPSDSSCGFLTDGGRPVGGFTIAGDEIAFPFLVEPFDDRDEFWREAIESFQSERGGAEIRFMRLPQSDAGVLAAIGAKELWSHRRMCRPTDVCILKPVEGYQLVTPTGGDLPEIVRVAHAAHSAGYTTKVYGERDIGAMEEAIRRRYALFSETHTWNLSVVAKRKGTSEIAGVCIAGVYPDSPNRFATVHQLSVLPEHRGRGLAEAMMLRSIGLAHRVSPVIGLQVLVGNPAERLYRKLGFISGPSFTDMIYTL